MTDRERQPASSLHLGEWIRYDQVIQPADHAVAKRPGSVKFLNFCEIHRRLTDNLLGEHPLRNEQEQGNDVRVLDADNDGYM